MAYKKLNSEKVGVEFLLAELQTAQTFLKLALTARLSNRQKTERNQKNARKAYDSFMHYRPRVSVSEEQHRTMESALKALKADFQKLGETI